MRIIAGAFRGRRLHSPKGDKIRPTIDRVREAVFNIIAAEISDASVLDLFAGTGAMGLEALSRGAAGCVFVDQSDEAVRLIRENVALCGVQENVRIVREAIDSAVRRLVAKNELFDLIFMDPPYGKGQIEKTLGILDAVAGQDALVIAESHVKDESPAHLTVWSKDRERRYGDTLISIYSRK
jgi:16S rRNA (guanine(966)-N(2))-methyltransferase RsmD